MEPHRIAFLLIALGASFLLARWVGDAGWLWTLLAGAAFVAAYARSGGYGLLLVGGVLVGVAVGLLLGGRGWPGAFPVSVGAGLLTVEGLEPRPGSVTRPLGIGLLALGLVWGLLASGPQLASSVGLASILIGALLLWRRREA